MMDFNEVLQLPQFVEEVEEKKLSHATYPNVDLLTEDQRTIFDEVMEVVKVKESKIYLIRGYAGTGKTFLVSQLVEAILSSTSHRVAVTAPTNKAVKVLKRQSKFGVGMLNLRFSTIHSLLGLRQTIIKGKEVFKKKREEDVKVGDYTVIILDEVSMFSDELYLQLMPYLKLYNIKLILVGDPAQIPPINKPDCIPFTKSGVAEWEIQKGTLLKVLRQAADSPIIQVTMKIRAALGRADILPVRESQYMSNYDGLYYIKEHNAVLVDQILNTYFTSENFAKNPDFAKVVCYTRDCVSRFNNRIRKMIYGKDIGKLCIGEKLIADKPIANPTDEDVLLFNNNDEFEVVSFTIEQGEYKNVPLTYYIVEVSEGEKKANKKIKVIHEDSQSDYDLVLNHIRELALAEKGWKSSAYWKDFYALQKVFAQVMYNYAITTHKAQGSTYTNAIVAEFDMDVNYRIKERNRIKYTAFTRASEKLFVIN